MALSDNRKKILRIQKLLGLAQSLAFKNKLPFGIIIENDQALKHISTLNYFKKINTQCLEKYKNAKIYIIKLDIEKSYNTRLQIPGQEYHTLFPLSRFIKFDIEIYTSYRGIEVKKVNKKIIKQISKN